MKQKGANKLIAVDVIDQKLAIAKQLGADYTINAQRENAVQRILEITEGCGADVVVEAAGRPRPLMPASSASNTMGRSYFTAGLRKILKSTYRACITTACM